MIGSNINEYDHYQGDVNAPLILMEYGDFECEHCGEAYWQVKKLQEYFGEDMCFVYRNFPLTQSHPAAFVAAIAAEAAGLQNKFWEMHNVIFEHQEYLEEGLDGIFLLAKKIELNPLLLQNDMRKSLLKEKVENDFEIGVRSGVNKTPTFFINGYRYNGIPVFDEMMEAIQELSE